jgi:hypothetical protein
VPEDPDSELVSRVRAGDEGAFAELAGKYQGAMLSIARGYVPSGAVAEEVVQEAWIGVLRGIGRFERRSSFRTWLFRILVNRAISAGVRERRSVPVDDMGPVVDGGPHSRRQARPRTSENSALVDPAGRCRNGGGWVRVAWHPWNLPDPRSGSSTRSPRTGSVAFRPELARCGSKPSVSCTPGWCGSRWPR